MTPPPPQSPQPSSPQPPQKLSKKSTPALSPEARKKKRANDRINYAARLQRDPDFRAKRNQIASRYYHRKHPKKPSGVHVELIF
jgi:hypothetical protein